jgi:3-hexulose-6-phosphate synthase/6-phospho-3-hexuloisomerase
MEPKLQVALDFLNLRRAMKVAREAAAGGADILEAGTPLIKSEGLDAVRELRAAFPKHTIVADLKTMDAGRIEMEAAAKAGADVAIVMGAASLSTVAECVEAGKNYGIEVGVDFLGVEEVEDLARRMEEMGVHHVGIHIPIDDQMHGADPLEKIRRLRGAVQLPIAAAGGIHSEMAADVAAAGADIVIVGGAITKSVDAKKATEEIKRALVSGERIQTQLYKRVGPDQLRETFLRVSTPNISDAMHRHPCLAGILPLFEGIRMAGPAVTVRAYPGDWAKPVEAIERTGEGEILVIEARGRGPALWGELATESALNRKIGGIVIDGAIRDVPEIREHRFPAFARMTVSEAGEPKGLGEIGVPIVCAGQPVCPGDWIVGDDNGVMVIPRGRAVEIANRAMGVLELENRLRGEIRAASTLSEVMELLRWEKK